MLFSASVRPKNLQLLLLGIELNVKEGGWLIDIDNFSEGAIVQKISAQLYLQKKFVNVSQSASFTFNSPENEFNSV